MNERAIGTHAPSRNLIREAEKYRASMEPKKKMKQMARKIFLCQHKIMTRDIRQVVTSMTVITARPVQSKLKMSRKLRTRYIAKTSICYKDTDIYSKTSRRKHLDKVLDMIYMIPDNDRVPEALPMRFVSLKPTVTVKHSNIKVQFISGM